MKSGNRNTQQSDSFVFFGNSRFSWCVLVTLHSLGWTPRAVVTQTNSPVAIWATHISIPVVYYQDLLAENLIDKLKTFGAKFFLVAAFPKLDQSVFSLPPRGTLNIHPSLLPLFRGKNPVPAQIIVGHEQFGVSIHEVQEQLDVGPVVAQQKLSLAQHEPNASEVGLSLAVAGAQLAAEVLPGWVNKEKPAVPQSDATASYCKDVVPDGDTIIKPSLPDNEQHLYFRALGQFGQFGYEFKHSNAVDVCYITKAYFRNKVFVIQSVKPKSTNEEMSYDDFLQQYSLDENAEWRKHCAESNSDVTSGIDLTSNNPYEQLRELIIQKAIVRASDQTFVKDSGETVQEGWLLDFRTLLLQPNFLELVADLFWKHYAQRGPLQVAGQESAAIPLITAIVLRGKQLGHTVNGFYVRKSRKKTGLQKLIEGTVTSDPIILVDDLVNSAQTMRRQVDQLTALGHTVSDIFVIVHYHPKDFYRFAITQNITINSLLSRESLGLAPAEATDAFSEPDSFLYLWKFQSNNPNHFYVLPKSRPALDAQKLFFGSDNGIFWALNQDDGEVAWKFKIHRTSRDKAIFSSPLVHDGLVIFGAYDGHVYALDCEKGKLVWDFYEADWVGSSPAAATELGLLFIGLEFGLSRRHGGLVALDIKTGRKRWQFAMPEYTHASPAYCAKHQVVGVGCNDGVFRLFKADSGELLWEYQTEGEIRSGAAFDETSGTVIFGSHDCNYYAVSIKTGKLLHTFQTDGINYSTPLVTKTAVYLTSLDRRLYCLDPVTFSERWQFETGGRIFTNPIMVEERVYIGSNDGYFYELSNDGELLRVASLGARIVNNAVHNPTSERFFVPTHENHIYCLKRI